MCRILAPSYIENAAFLVIRPFPALVALFELGYTARSDETGEAHMTHPLTLGIDFGTSNSAAGILVNNAPYLIEIEPGEKTLPTSIFFDGAKQRTLFGNQANRALIDGAEGRFMRALKSVLGTPLMHEPRTFLGQKMTFVDIISAFLTEVKSKAETACYQDFDYALSGRPVLFHSEDETRNAQALVDLELCYQKAGFKDVAFMYEPEAAAVTATHGKDHNGLGLIVDIGGGTSDFTVFLKGATGIEILASHGVRVGGTNFDKALNLDHAMPLLGRGGDIRKEMGTGLLRAPNALFNDLATWERIPALYTQSTQRDVAHLERMAVEPPLFHRLSEVLEHEMGHDLAFAVERGKIQINDKDRDQSKINMGFIERGLEANLTTADLTASLATLVGRVQDAARETITMAETTPDMIDTVIFVGGSSLMIDIQSAMTSLFPKAQFEQSDAFTAVVDGLAISAQTAFAD